MSVKISVIIPNFNCEKYLDKCLASVATQTLKEIEIIVIDDASTDKSLEVIEKFAKEDNRFKVIKYATNKSQSQARKDGVLASKGEYIMFLDSDDYLEKNACEELYDEIKKEAVDIICFNSNVIKSTPLISDQRVASLQRWLNSSDTNRYSKTDLLEKCFISKTLPFTLWNKIYNSRLCKDAFNCVKDGYYPKGQDVYAFFFIATKANSLLKINKTYYNYSFGTGVAGSQTLTVKQFQKICAQGKIVHELNEYFFNNINFQKYINALDDSYTREIASKWLTQVSLVDSAQCFQCLLENFKSEKIVEVLLEKNVYAQSSIAKRIEKINTPQKKNIKNIGIFYHRLTFGGVQKVIREQAKILLDHGFNVYLFIEEINKNEQIFQIDNRAKIVYIEKSVPYNKSNAIAHNKSFSQKIIDNPIELMIYHAGTSGNLLWDLILLKGHNIRTCVFHHESFAHYITTMTYYGIGRHDVFKLADQVVTLTKTAEIYYKSLGINATFIPNITPKIDNNNIALGNTNKILCIGRLDDSVKQYHESLKILKEIIKENPKVKLHFVGEFKNPSNKTNFINFAKKLGVFNNVVFEGAHSELEKFYKDATCLLITSLSEGFSLILAEAKSFGLPVILYDLPYLDLVKDNLGVVRVEQGNTKGASEAFKMLNENSNFWKRKQKECLESLGNFQKTYNSELLLIDLITAPVSAINNIEVNSEEVGIIVRTIMSNYLNSVKKYKALEEKSRTILCTVKKPRNEFIFEVMTKLKTLFNTLFK